MPDAREAGAVSPVDATVSDAVQNARLACLVRQAALVLRRQEAARPRRAVVAHSSEDLRVGAEFLQRYRHARCRDGGSGRDGTLMDVIGTAVYLRGRDGLEFTCRIHDLVVLDPPPPVVGRHVRYVGVGDAAPRPDGVLTELWAVDRGKVAIVQPPARHAWFALLSELESIGFALGPVADWAEPPFVSDSAGRRPPRR